MDFITYNSLLFNNLADQEAALFTATTPVLLDAVNVCNITESNIRINLMLRRSAVDNFLIYNTLIPPNESFNLLSLGKLKVFLGVSDSLLCFSKGYSQLFDCTICYTALNEFQP
jgi:hypothetical protein